MKLLYCPNCGDLFNLIVDDWKECRCGRVGGQYAEDALHAEYKTLGNAKCIPLCFSNSSFVEAFKAQKIRDKCDPAIFNGITFEAWICPKNSLTFQKAPPKRKKKGG